MAYGIKTGGRKKGVPNRASVARAREIAESGETPLEYMLRIMRDTEKPEELRFEAAKAVAPFIHPKLSSAEVRSETTVRYVARVPDKAQSPDQWQKQHTPQPTIQ
jgi:hypothetical protein